MSFNLAMVLVIYLLTYLLLRLLTFLLAFAGKPGNDLAVNLWGISFIFAALVALLAKIVARYWVPILIMSMLAGLLTIVTVPWLCSRLFKDHRFHRTLIIFGVSTGTLPTGLALLRVIDPDFETPVASDYMYSCGLTFLLAIPFILSINLPTYSHTTGNPLYFWSAIAVSFGYLLFVIISFRIIARKRAGRSPSNVWLRED